MIDQPEKIKTSEKEKPKVRVGVIILGFTILFAAIALVTLLTTSVVRNSQKNRVAAVRITKTGFVPATLVVKQGTKITWTNDDKGLHQVASNPFPKDTDLPGLKSQILNDAQDYVYTANTVGSFGYHDQLKPTLNATLVVQKK